MWRVGKTKIQNKKKTFLFHYQQQQTGESLNQQLLTNVLRHGPITYYSANFQQHKNIYNF